MRRLPDSQSSASALLVRPLMMRSSAPGYSAMICQSPSAIRFILKFTRAFAMAPYRPFAAEAKGAAQVKSDQILRDDQLHGRGGRQRHLAALSRNHRRRLARLGEQRGAEFVA